MINTNEFLVTVVVPTHNRSKYAISCIKSVLEIASEQLQIAVHDTSDDEGLLREWAEKQTDPRLKYVHWKERLSMTDNHERALDLADGLYVCLIGDDDTVSSKIIDAAIYAESKGLTVLSPIIKASYYWPDFRSRFYGDAHAGRIYVEPFDARIQSFSVANHLHRALLLACQGTEFLPRLYHGLVLRQTLNELQRSYGKVFFGTSPDVSAALLLSLKGGTYHVVDYPFTMPGGAGGSNSGRSASGQHKGNLNEDAHIKPFRNLVWPDVIPKFFSVETVWAQAAWDTLLNTQNDALLEEFNLARLYVLCLFRHPAYWRLTTSSWKRARKSEHPKAQVNNFIKECFQFILERTRALALRFKDPSPRNGKRVLAVVEDVQLARKELDDYLSVEAKRIGG
ncbi:glycosyltransferase family 2 protein [Stutzerimonas sp. 381-2]